MSELLQALESHAADPRLGRVIRQAIDFVTSATIKREHRSTGHGQSSTAVADLHALRKRLGYYAEASTLGLDESIAVLRSADTRVWLAVIETDRGLVALWRSEDGTPLGVIVF